MLTNTIFSTALMKIRKLKSIYCKKTHVMRNSWGVYFNNQLKFDFYIEKVFQNTTRKIHALARGDPLHLSKKRILMIQITFNLSQQ